MGKAYVLRCPACHDETEVIQGIGNRDGNNEAFFSRISDFKNEIRRRMKAGESLEEISKTIQIHHMPSAHGDRLTDAERLKALTFLRRMLTWTVKRLTVWMKRVRAGAGTENPSIARNAIRLKNASGSVSSVRIRRKPTNLPSFAKSAEARWFS
jgi:hypothetical protein